MPLTEPDSHDEQIKLVSTFDWLDFGQLYGIDEELREIMRGSLFVDAARCDALCRGLKGRVEMLAKAMDSQVHFSAASDRIGDVAVNVAYSGGQDEDMER